jgi:putative hydrolase of the HAD superfamily
VKPEREIFEYVIADLNVAPVRIAFFDDTAINVEGARQTGMDAYETDGIDELEARLRSLGVLSPERAP